VPPDSSPARSPSSAPPSCSPQSSPVATPPSRGAACSSFFFHSLSWITISADGGRAATIGGPRTGQTLPFVPAWPRGHEVIFFAGTGGVALTLNISTIAVSSPPRPVCWASENGLEPLTMVTASVADTTTGTGLTVNCGSLCESGKLLV